LHRRALLAFVTLLLSSGPLYAQTEPQRELPPFFTWRDALLAAAFVGGTIAAAPVDLHVAEKMRGTTLRENRIVDTSAGFFRFMGTPGPQLIGLAVYGYGRLADNERAARLGLHGMEALLIANVMTTTIKIGAGRARPRHDKDNPYNFKFMRGWLNSEYMSFPSGHSTTAFAAAAAVTAETAHWWPNGKWIVGPLMFGGASMVGISRLYHNDHWASDVMAGAAIGTFAGLKVVRYNYRNPDNRVEKALLSVVITIPTGQGDAPVQWSVAPHTVLIPRN
jgi:membrane-associated phospholipid phosphatase